MSGSARTRVFQQRADGTLVTLRVKPRSSRNQLEGISEETLVVRLTAAPVDNAANEMLVKLIAEWLGVSKSNIQIVSGEHNRLKTVLIKGLGESDVRKRLGVK